MRGDYARDRADEERDRKQALLEVDRCDELLVMSRGARRRRGVMLKREMIEAIRTAAAERAGLPPPAEPAATT